MIRQQVNTFLLSIAAGAAISLGALLNVLARSFILNSLIAKIIGSFLFPIGLTLVCYLGLNLFTGKIGYLLDQTKKYPLFLLNVYLGNLVGSLICGFIAYFIFKDIPTIYQVITSISHSKESITSIEDSLRMFAGSIICGTLVYLAVLSYRKLNHHVCKIGGIFIAIALFVYFGFDHCIANMFYFTFSFSFKNWGSYLNIVIATIGNSLGAIALNFARKN